MIRMSVTLAASLALCTASAAEFRGVWVATVDNLDFPRSVSAQMFRQNFRRLADGLAKRSCNAVIFQVRSNCDAFYPGRFAPYSRWMSGKEGRGFAGFDPLKFMITETRRRGMEFHAWFNPYRVVRSTKLSKSAYLATLDPGNFARKNPHLVMAVPLGKNEISLMLDPGEPAVIRHIVDVVSDVASRYRPDAIHFDDYFYPYDSKSVPDKDTFRRNNPHRMSLADWRRANVDQMIFLTRTALNRINHGQAHKVKFGISPFGIWRNRSKECPGGSLTDGKESYSVLFADSRKWVNKRWIDYIVPQIYWHRAHRQASFTSLLDWWCRIVRGTGVKLYIGHALYRFGTPEWGKDELRIQLHQVRLRMEASGSVLFSSRFLLNPPNTATRAGVSGVWRKPLNR